MNGYDLTVETIEKDGHKATVYYDEDPESPREWEGNVGTMVCWHTRYVLGDEQANDYEGAQKLGRRAERAMKNGGVAIELFLLDHSGITMRAGSDFSDCDPGAWDSGQVGFIYVTKTDITKHFGGDLDKARAALYAEVEVYDQYLRGDVYGITIERDGEWIDGYSGIFGFDEAKDEAEAALEDSIARCSTLHSV